MPRQHVRPRVHHFIAAIVILLLLLLPASALAQDPVTAPDATWPDCKFQCTANDVNLIGYWLGDINGDPLPNTCTPGEEVSAYIWGGFHNTTSTSRYAVILLAEIWEDGELVHSFYEDSPAGVCSVDSIAPGGDSAAIIYGQSEPFTWTCGTIVEVRNSVVSWDTSATTCATAERTCAARGTSKCGIGQNLIVQAPLIADFSGGPSCLGTATQFTNETTGGIEPYASSWDFGDTGSSTEANPSHTYAAAGNYDVMLQVTDSDVPPTQDSQTWPVSIWGNPTAAFSYAPNGTEKWQYQFTNGSTAATDNGCSDTTPLSYLWHFGDSNTSTEKDPLHVFEGSQSSYNVSLTTTDACGCTNSTQKTVYFGPNAVTVRNFSAAAGRLPAVPIAAGVLAVGALAAAGAVWRKKQ